MKTRHPQFTKEELAKIASVDTGRPVTASEVKRQGSCHDMIWIIFNDGSGFPVEIHQALNFLKS
jgi:hypothetical protein